MKTGNKTKIKKEIKKAIANKRNYDDHGKSEDNKKIVIFLMQEFLSR